MGSLIADILKGSREVKSSRTPLTILGHGMSELGELSEEVLIAGGHSYKEVGDDGVVGEAVDVILCMVDLIDVYSEGKITEEQLREIAEKKLAKWKSKEESRS